MLFVQYVRDARAAQTLATSPHVSAATRDRAHRIHRRILIRAEAHAESLVASGRMTTVRAWGWLDMVARPPAA
jgi:hypothetical protein